MKKKLLFTASLVLMLIFTHHINLHAQITVTQENLISAYDDITIGTQFIAFDEAAGQALISQSGENQVWDLTSISFTASIESEYEISEDITGVPGGDDEHFENAMMVMSNFILEVNGFEDEEDGPPFSELHTFLGIEDNLAVSYGGVGIIGPEGDELRIYERPFRVDFELPATFGSAWSFDFEQEAIGPGFAETTDYQVSTEVDGYGELITPAGTFSVLRIRTEETFDLGGTPFTSTEYTFVDESGIFLAMIDEANYVSYFGYETGTSTEPDQDAPVVFQLDQNYPNPFNPTTNITYTLNESSHVQLDVYSVNGQHIETLAQGSQAPGAYTVTFDAGSLSSGVYIYKLQAGAATEIRKMMLIK